MPDGSSYWINASSRLRTELDLYSLEDESKRRVTNIKIDQLFMALNSDEVQYSQ